MLMTIVSWSQWLSSCLHGKRGGRMRRADAVGSVRGEREGEGEVACWVECGKGGEEEHM